MKFVNYVVRDRIGFVTLNRPEKRNALSFEMVSELKAALTLAESDAAVKVIILKASGEAFCAGADLDFLQKMQQFTFEENLEDSRHLKNLFVQIYTLKNITRTDPVYPEKPSLPACNPRWPGHGRSWWLHIPGHHSMTFPGPQQSFS